MTGQVKVLRNITPSGTPRTTGATQFRGPLDDFADEFDFGEFKEFGRDHLRYLRVRERELAPVPEYMKFQDSITWQERRKVIEWLSEVQLHYNLRQETLQLAVQLIDRFACFTRIRREEFQAIAGVCLWIAAKFEENHGHVPTIHQIIHVCPFQYSVRELVDVERAVLTKLEFEIGPVYETFRKIYTKQLDIKDNKVKILSQYLTELFILDRRSLYYRCSTVSFAAMYLAQEILYGPELPMPENRKIRQDIECCLSDMRDSIAIPSDPLYKKYSADEFLNVSSYQRNWRFGCPNSPYNQKYMLSSTMMLTPPPEYPNGNHKTAEYINTSPFNQYQGHANVPQHLPTLSSSAHGIDRHSYMLANAPPSYSNYQQTRYTKLPAISIQHPQYLSQLNTSTSLYSSSVSPHEVFIDPYSCAWV